jgi:hypothetical protein
MPGCLKTFSTTLSLYIGAMGKKEVVNSYAQNPKMEVEVLMTGSNSTLLLESAMALSIFAHGR